MVNLIKKLLNNGRGYDVVDPISGDPGKVVTYGIGIYAQKGSEAIDSTVPISFTDVVTYPASAVVPSHKIYDWGSEPACAANTYNTGDLPYGKTGIAGSATSANSVSDSGVFLCL